jgi:hypothetical protein
VTTSANIHIKRFAGACHKNKEGIAKNITLKGIASEGIILKGVLYHKNKEDKQKHKKVIISLVKVKLRQL